MTEKNKVAEVAKPTKPSSNKSTGNPLKIVRLRNRFFFMLYRYSTLVFLSSLACLICSILFLFVFIRQPVPPQYIPIDEDGRYIKLEPLSVCKDDSEVKKFTMSAIKRIYKYDYINYADQLQDAAQYFTKDGWNEYVGEYASSKTLFAIKENKWIVTVQPNSLPSITKKELINNICTWEVKADVQISYIGPSGQILKGDVYMKIVRNSVINNPDGLGISKSVFVETKI